MVGGYWRREGEQLCVDKAPDAAAESQSSARVHCTIRWQTQLYAVLHERRVHGLRPGVQVLDRSAWRWQRQRKWLRININCCQQSTTYWTAQVFSSTAALHYYMCSVIILILIISPNCSATALADLEFGQSLLTVWLQSSEVASHSDSRRILYKRITFEKHWPNTSEYFVTSFYWMNLNKLEQTSSWHTVWSALINVCTVFIECSTNSSSWSCFIVAVYDAYSLSDIKGD